MTSTNPFAVAEQEMKEAREWLKENPRSVVDASGNTPVLRNITSMADFLEFADEDEWETFRHAPGPVARMSEQGVDFTIKTPPADRVDELLALVALATIEARRMDDYHARAVHVLNRVNAAGF